VGGTIQLHATAVPGGDAGVFGGDAGVPGADAGVPGADAGVPGADAGVPGADAGAAVFVRWKATRGQIAAPRPDTTFTCLIGGNQALTLVASDGRCDETRTIAVFCVPAACGNGRVDPGEQCDPPNGTTCLDGCSRPCGNGLIEAGEQCDPPDGVTCSTTCQSIPLTAGP
jgi:hypothetical protein